jgi:hypothetical protein
MLDAELTDIAPFQSNAARNEMIGVNSKADDDSPDYIPDWMIEALGRVPTESDDCEIAEGKEAELLRHLKHAHQQLVVSLVADEGERREVFEHQWDKRPDEYKLLFDPSLRPYVNSMGQHVTLLMMATARRLAEEKNRRAFRWETELARRRARREWEWDQYRLFDSELVLPFVSSSGELMDETTIRERRTRAKTELKGMTERVVRRSTDRVERCLATKQSIEHQLFVQRNKVIS